MEVLLALFGIPVLIVGYIVYFIRSEMKKSEQQEEADRLITQRLIELEKEKPRYKIQFQVIGETHETEAFEPRVISVRFRSVIGSKELADRVLIKAMEKGFISNKDKIFFPTCNVLNAKVVQHVEHKL